MNTLKKIISTQIRLLDVSSSEIFLMNSKLKQLVSQIKNSIRDNKIKAEVFIGGSYAKKTLIKKSKYDVDIFIRFDPNYREEDLNELIKKIAPPNSSKLHGSRDYFIYSEGDIDFEIIPCLKIKKPENARNVTDLSYFHVNYILKQIRKNPRLADEIKLAKSFLHASGCYGAESYIHGFSGYAVELLISYYKTFLKFVKSISKLDDKKKLIIDPIRFFKNKEDILKNLNESKLISPIIFIDPTFKERNALSALSLECLNKFKYYCIKFLKNPSIDLFQPRDIELSFDKKYKESVKIRLTTDRQAGDIAGTKLKKFAGYLAKESNRYFDIKAWEFIYNEVENYGKLMIAYKPKKEIIFPGPPVKMKESLVKFKKEHSKIKIIKGKAFAYEKNNLVFEEFIRDFLNQKNKVIGEMGISKIELL